jgi:hypothetical protein
MIRLLDSCIRLLANQGMNKLLIDAVAGGDEGFQSMGEYSPNGINTWTPLTRYQASKNGRDTGTCGKTSKVTPCRAFGTVRDEMM